MSKKSKKKEFPEQLFVRTEYDESDGEPYYLAFENIEDAVDGDGPTSVATYRFANSSKVKKIISEELVTI